MKRPREEAFASARERQGLKNERKLTRLNGLKSAYYSRCREINATVCLIVLLGIHREARYDKLINGAPRVGSLT
jgi:hypothetical protein